MLRRTFLKSSAVTGGMLTASHFLSYFMANGLPPMGAKAFGMAEDKVKEFDDPRFLIYWMLEGGWNGYSMFNPVMSPNNVIERIDDVSKERYRVKNFGEEGYGIYNEGNIRYGYLAEKGKSLFPDMAVLSSMHTGSFHSGERLNTLYGHYSYRITNEREEDERTVMQAFAEAYGQPYVLPNITWHRWLADGELNEVQYTGRRGDYHALGPSHAHTIHAGTPDRLRSFMRRMYLSSTDQVNREIQKFLGDVDHHLLDDTSGEVIKSYHSARAIYQSLAERGASFDPAMLQNFFSDHELKEAFGVKPKDEIVSHRSINGNKERSKFSPNANVQAMMAFELIRAGYTCGAWIENRGIRRLDTHHVRRNLWKPDGTPVGQREQKNMIDEDLWDPLLVFVQKMKETELGDTGKSLYDHATIVLTSEFGRTIHGDIDAIRQMPIPDTEKEQMIGAQDISQHWKVTSAAFLGGAVKGDSQYGRVGEHTLLAIPIMPDGSLDPHYDPITGVLLEGKKKHPDSWTPNHGDVYSTALHLCDLNPEGRGRNTRGPLKFIKKA